MLTATDKSKIVDNLMNLAWKLAKDYHFQQTPGVIFLIAPTMDSSRELRKELNALVEKLKE